MTTRPFLRRRPRRPILPLLLLAATSLFARPPIPEDFRLAMIAPEGREESLREVARDLDWKFSSFANTAEGWTNLIRALPKTDIVVTLGGVEAFPAPFAPSIRSFMENGGAFVVTEIASPNPLTTLAAISDKDVVPRWKSDPAPVPCGDLLETGTLLSFPFPARRPTAAPVGGFESDFALVRAWEPAAFRAADNRPCVLLRRLNRGLLVYTSARFLRPAFYANLSKALELQRRYLRFDGLSWTGTKDGVPSLLPPHGPGRCEVRLRGTGPTDVAVRLRLTLRQGEASRTFRAATTHRPNEPFDVRIPALFDMNGTWEAELVLEGDRARDDLLLACETVAFPPALSMEAPLYRKSLSAARRDGTVRFALNVALYAEDLRGAAVSVDLLDRHDHLVSTLSFRLVGESRREFDLPLPLDAPDGRYTVRATLTRPDRSPIVTEQTFSVVPVRRRQVFVDQDGVLLDEGRPWFPLGFLDVRPTDAEAVAKTRADLVQIFASPTDEDGKRTLAGLRKAGLRVLLRDDILRYTESSVPDEDGRWPFEKDRTFRRREREALDSEAVAFWTIAENPAREDLPALRAIREHRATLDPDHPAILFGDPTFCDGSDVLAVRAAVPPSTGPEPLTALPDALDAALHATGHRQAVLAVARVSAGDTPAVLRARAYLAFVHGARGLLWQGWSEGVAKDPATLEALTAVFSEARLFRDALLTPGARPLRTADGLVHARLCGDDRTGRFLLAVNAGEIPAKASLPCPEREGWSFEPLFGAPEASFRRGSVRCALPALGVAVYRVSPPPPPAEP